MGAAWSSRLGGCHRPPRPPQGAGSRSEFLDVCSAQAAGGTPPQAAGPWPRDRAWGGRGGDGLGNGCADGAATVSGRPPLHVAGIPVAAVADAGSGRLLSAAGRDLVLSSAGRTADALRRWRLPVAHRSLARAAAATAEQAGAELALGGARDGSIHAWASIPADGGGGGEADVKADAPAVRTFLGHELPVGGLTVCGGRRLCSGGRDHTTRLWDLETGQCVSVRRLPLNVVTAQAAVPGEPSLVLQAGEDLRVRLWDLRSMGVAREWAGHATLPLGLDASPCGRWAASCAGGFEGDGCEVRLWDLRGGNGGGGEDGSSGCAGVLRGHGAAVSACAFLRPQQPGAAAAQASAPGLPPLFLMTASMDRTVKLWDARRGLPDAEGATGDGGADVDSSLLTVGPAPGEDEGATSAGAGPATCVAALPPSADGPQFCCGRMGGAVQVWQVRLPQGGRPALLARVCEA